MTSGFNTVYLQHGNHQYWTEPVGTKQSGHWNGTRLHFKINLGLQLKTALAFNGIFYEGHRNA